MLCIFLRIFSYRYYASIATDSGYEGIEGRDIDPNLMIRKTLLDNTAVHTRGWDPNGVTTDFTITDLDVQGQSGSNVCNSNASRFAFF